MSMGLQTGQSINQGARASEREAVGRKAWTGFGRLNSAGLEAEHEDAVRRQAADTGLIGVAVELVADPELAKLYLDTYTSDDGRKHVTDLGDVAVGSEGFVRLQPTKDGIGQPWKGLLIITGFGSGNPWDNQDVAPVPPHTN